MTVSHLTRNLINSPVSPAKFLLHKFNHFKKRFFCTPEDGTRGCKCGTGRKFPNETVDIGNARNWPLFPIAALRFGDTGDSDEYIHFRIGPLICRQGMSYECVSNNADTELWIKSISFNSWTSNFNAFVPVYYILIPLRFCLISSVVLRRPCAWR